MRRVTTAVWLREIAAEMRERDNGAADIAAGLLEDGAEDVEFFHAETWHQLRDRREEFAAIRAQRTN
jgi:hypothetical protein